MISPSLIAVRALGLTLEGTRACSAEEARQPCAVCGGALLEGEPVDDCALPHSFTNHSALAHPGGALRCGACTTIMVRSVFQMQCATAVFCADGCFPIMRREHRAWLIQTPPEPPFVVTVQNAKQQHVVWRAPVTLSRDLVLVRVGEQILRLRMPLLARAAQAARALVAAAKESGKRKPSKEAENPFVNDPKLQASEMGCLKEWARESLPALPAETARPLLHLNAGEIWALNAMLLGAPEMPAPLLL